MNAFTKQQLTFLEMKINEKIGARMKSLEANITFDRIKKAVRNRYIVDSEGITKEWCWFVIGERTYHIRYHNYEFEVKFNRKVETFGSLPAAVSSLVRLKE